MKNAVLVMAALILVQSATALFCDNRGHRMGAMMERDMRNELFAHYQKLPFCFFDREKPGSLMSRITGDLLNLAELCHHGPENIMLYALSFIGAFVTDFVAFLLYMGYLTAPSLNLFTPFNSTTVIDNIRYGKPEAGEDEVIEAAKKAHAHDFILRLPKGYYTGIGPRGITLSGGQRHRLSIARVFLKNPPILIFDEATSALDNESEGLVYQALRELAKDRTAFIIAHRLSTVKNAGRVLTLTGRGLEEKESLGGPEKPEQT